MAALQGPRNSPNARYAARAADQETADRNFVAVEAAAWDNYMAGVAFIEAELTITGASIEDQFT